MGQTIRIIFSAIAGFAGLFVSYWIMESDTRLIRAHHLDQTVLQALQTAFGPWGGAAVYYFFFVVLPGYLFVSVLFWEEVRWKEVAASAAKVIHMDEWLRRDRDPS